MGCLGNCKPAPRKITLSRRHPPRRQWMNELLVTRNWYSGKQGACLIAAERDVKPPKHSRDPACSGVGRAGTGAGGPASATSCEAAFSLYFAVMMALPMHSEMDAAVQACLQCGLHPNTHKTLAAAQEQGHFKRVWGETVEQLQSSLSMRSQWVDVCLVVQTLPLRLRCLDHGLRMSSREYMFQHTCQLPECHTSQACLSQCLSMCLSSSVCAMHRKSV